MAVMEHAYYASFGYQVTSFYAPSRFDIYNMIFNQLHWPFLIRKEYSISADSVIYTVLAYSLCRLVLQSAAMILEVKCRRGEVNHV
jgi:hypothetical protein